MIVIGDIHGRVSEYLNLLRRYKKHSSVQVGDFGFGFIPTPVIPDNAWFIRGNHDNPEEASAHPQYLGDYGIRILDGVKFFFVSGAWSIDWQMRKEGVSWWRNEELSLRQLNEALEVYKIDKPDVVITHDGPNVITDMLLNKYALHKTKPMPTRTTQALDAMFEYHQPAKWIFGHWHVNHRETIEGTDFQCLPELGWCEVNV